jgi:peptidoglycan/LPS O-acetylase OafA/YrhL
MADDNNIQSVGALRLAATVQAILGAVVAAWGAFGFSSFLSLPVRDVSFEDGICFTYLIVGSAAMLVAWPLARRVRRAWLASCVLTGSILLLPVMAMISVFADNQNGHGAEGALLLLLVALPVAVFLGVLYREGRSALKG